MPYFEFDGIQTSKLLESEFEMSMIRFGIPNCLSLPILFKPTMPSCIANAAKFVYRDAIKKQKFSHFNTSHKFSNKLCLRIKHVRIIRIEKKNV